MWFKHISLQSCGVYIFIRNTYACSFVLSLAHFFHSRKSLSIFGVEAHQHSTSSSEYQEAFQHEADESAGLEKINVRGEAEFCFIVPLALEIISWAAVSKRLFAPSPPLLEHPCQAGSAAPAAPASCRGITAGCDSGLGWSGWQG